MKRRLRTKLPVVISFLVPLLTGVCLSIMTWRRLGDVQIDFPRELYNAWIISEGGVLGRDLFTLYGPTSVLLNATVFQIFGPHITTLFGFNFFIALFILLLVFLIGYRIGGALGGGLSAMFFSGALCFSHLNSVGIFNFVTPYSHELTHGLAAGLFSVLSLERAFATRRRFWVFCGGVGFGIAITTKPEVCLAVFAAIIAASIFSWTTFRPKRFPWVWLGSFLGGVLLIVGLVFAALARQSGVVESLRLTFWGVIAAAQATTLNSPFTRSVLGSDNLSRNLIMLVFAAGAAFLIVCILKRLAREVASTGGWLYVLSLMAGCFVCVWISYLLPWQESGRVLPLVMLGMAGIVAVRFFNVLASIREKDSRTFLLWVMVVFSGSLLLKTAFKPNIGHYGFALGLPAFVVAISFVSGMGSRIEWSATARATFSVFVALTVLSGVAKLAQISHGRYSEKTYAVGFGSDILLTMPPQIDPRGAAINGVAIAIGKSFGVGDTLTVLPEGPFLNFLLAQKNPVPLPVVVSPVELGLFGIERIEDSLKAAPPTRVVIASRSVYEHGLSRFGTRAGYGQEIVEWINGNYNKVLQIGADPTAVDGFGAILYELKNHEVPEDH